MHRSNYKPLVLFDVLPFNHLSIPSIPLIICSPKYETIFDPGWNVHLRISTIRTFHHSLVDFLGSDNHWQRNRQWKSLRRNSRRWHFAFPNSTDTVSTIVAIPRLICFPCFYRVKFYVTVNLNCSLQVFTFRARSSKLWIAWIKLVIRKFDGRVALMKFGLLRNFITECWIIVDSDGICYSIGWYFK